MAEWREKTGSPCLREDRARWRIYLQACPKPACDLHVGLAATITAEPCIPFLGVALLERGFSPAISIAPFNQVFQVCLRGAAAFDTMAADRPLDVIVLLWRMEEVLGEASPEKDGSAMERLAQAVAQLRQSFSGSIVVALPPCPQTNGSSWLSLQFTETLASRHRSVMTRWSRLVADIDGVHVLDLDVLQRAFGMCHLHDARKWALYRQPWTEPFWHAVATRLARTLTAQRRPPKKCIVLDCDNTLWGGVVGEEGLTGIALGEDFPGNVYVAFQRQLLALQEQGVMLAIASKNDPEVVWEVFDRHDAMVLRRAHLAAHAVNWEPKSANIYAIAKQLNIGLDSMVFIDDSPYELAEVIGTCPGITGLQTPDERAYLPALLPEHAELFDHLTVSDEDRQRTTMMQAQSARTSLEEGLTHEAFLDALGLKVRVFPVAEQHVQRVAQLINKTNQFNLTTRRRTQDEVAALMDDPAWLVLAVDVSDRFGGYGLVGVIVAQRLGDGWFLDTCLMSCRVLGRGAETAFLCGVAALLQAEGGMGLEGAYVPTERNGLVKDFLAAHGFRCEGDRWRAAWADLPACPAHVELTH